MNPFQTSPFLQLPVSAIPKFLGFSVPKSVHKTVLQTFSIGIFEGFLYLIILGNPEGWFGLKIDVRKRDAALLSRELFGDAYAFFVRAYGPLPVGGPYGSSISKSVGIEPVILPSAPKFRIPLVPAQYYDGEFRLFGMPLHLDVNGTLLVRATRPPRRRKPDLPMKKVN